MDNLGKCHGKINIMIGLQANGNISNWLPTVFCGTYDVHMSITNNFSTEHNKRQMLDIFSRYCITSLSQDKKKHKLGEGANLQC